MTKQLNVRSDEAYRLAHEIAAQTDESVSDVVRKALADYARRLPALDGLTVQQRADVKALRAIVRKHRLNLKPGDSPSDHDWLYDDYGLPK